MAGSNFLINMLAFSAAPGMVIYMLITLALISFFIYIGITFFSKNRFRGISFGIFTKLIPLNDYIIRFNEELFNDLKNISRYHATKVDNLYEDPILSDIKSFMESINSDKEAFDQIVYSFFTPNHSFISDVPDMTNEDYKSKVGNLRSIMEKLYKNDFHERFGLWLNYDSMWNFISTDANTLLDSLVYDYISSSSNMAIQKSDAPLYKSLQDAKVKTDPKERFGAIKFSNEQFDALSELTKNAIKKQFMISLNIDSKKSKNIDAMLFVGATKNSSNDGKISQDASDEYCTLDSSLGGNLNTDKAVEDIGSGFTSEKLADLNMSLCFIDTLTHLAKQDYKVSNGMFNGSVKNLHESIVSAVAKAMKSNNSYERYMIIHNTCYQLFNELLYSQSLKAEKDARPKKVFLFHGEKDMVDDSSLKTNTMWIFCQLFFNIHIANCFKIQVEDALEYMGKGYTEDVTTLVTDTHVSIARLRYLIQDYFIIIQQYNDKSNPDEKDIRDFWEKRVNAFGFVVANTKENKPRSVPEGDYAKPKVNAKSSDNMWEADTDYVLQKNTPVALYFEYLSALLLELRHPRIPFFQSVMATIRYLIPPPDVLLNNFMNQIKGIRSTESTKNPINYDFSFKYNPAYDGLGGDVDKFVSLEDSAKKMTSTIDVGIKGDFDKEAAASAKTMNSDFNEGNKNLQGAQKKADTANTE